MSMDTATEGARTAPWKRWLPLAGLLAASAFVYLMGWHRYLTLNSLIDNRQALVEFVSGNLLLSVAIYMAAYITVVALSLPGAALLTILGGFIFGWALSLPATVTAATIGSVIVFQVVKTSLGAAIADRAVPWMTRLSDGFSRNAFSYLLFLRLVPVFPFFAVNAVAGLSRMPLRTFALATLVGIVPGTFVFTWLGRSLDGVIAQHLAAREACGTAATDCAEFSVSSLLTPGLLAAFVLLGVLALVPVAVKKWRKTP